jgi:hypothetical protein
VHAHSCSGICASAGWDIDEKYNKAIDAPETPMKRDTLWGVLLIITPFVLDGTQVPRLVQLVSGSNCKYPLRFPSHWNPSMLSNLFEMLNGIAVRIFLLRQSDRWASPFWLTSGNGLDETGRSSKINERFNKFGGRPARNYNERDSSDLLASLYRLEVNCDARRSFALAMTLPLEPPTDALPQ